MTGRYPIRSGTHTIALGGNSGGLVRWERTLAEILSEESPRRVIRFGIEDRWGESAPNDYLLEAFKMSPPRLSERIQKLVA